MSRRLATALAVLLVLSSAAAQNGPPPQVRAAIQSVEQMLEGTDDASLHAFADEHLASEYRASFGTDALMAHLKSLRSAVGGAIGGVRVERAPDGLRLEVQGAKEVAFALKLDDAGRITRLDLI